jgi:hypothetical protein
MPNPRIFALIGLASAVAAIAPTYAYKFEGIPRLDRPSVYAIAVRPETIWFCATAPRDTQHVTYGFARGPRSWTMLAGDRPCTNATRKVLNYFLDTLPVPVAPGMRVEVVIPPQPDSQAARRPRSTLRFIDSARSLSLDLKPTIAAERITRLLSRVGSVDEDTTAVGIGGVASNDTVAWIGLAGGFPEGEGSLGGIYRIDRRYGTWQYIVDSTLSWHTVTGLAQTRDWLWAGTQQPAEYGPFGRAGLRRMDLRTGDWRDFTPANSPIADALVVHVAGDDNAVAIATEKGLSVIELRASGSPREIDRWNTQYFIPAFVGDSLIIRLGSKSEALTEDGESPYMFVQEFAKRGHERPVFEQLKKIPLKVTRRAVENSFEVADWRLLANPSYSPILVSMLSSRNEGQRSAAAAVKRLRSRTPPAVREAARAAFTAFDTVGHPTPEDLSTVEALAAALRAFGDSSAIQWARRRLDKTESTIGPRVDNAVRISLITTAANIVAEAHDGSGLSLVIANGGVDPALDRNLMNPLAAFDTPRSWRKLVDIVERRHAEMVTSGDPEYYWREALRRATPVAFTEAATARRMKDYVRLGLRSDREQSRSAAIDAIRRVRLSGFGSSLVELLPDSTVVGQSSYLALVDLYGRADAPRLTQPTSTEGIRFWRKAMAAKPAVVSRAQGEQALSEWRRRQSTANRSERRR